MIKAIVFDFDGVIADTGRDIVASVQAAQKEYRMPVLDYDTILSYVGHGAKYLLDCSMPELPESLRAGALDWYKQYYEAHPCEETRLYPGFSELAEALSQKGVSMSIVSNKPRRSQSES